MFLIYLKSPYNTLKIQILKFLFNDLNNEKKNYPFILNVKLNHILLILY